ncbi:hypothetical protein GT037_010300 [Alternaria burnsii]|uniref:Uncharacterized protein n=1 Tax=Alternaria burnsii TaxID=1187904 RepID=A0A8H7E9G4_9PLEO|nr:uncharacterized protein GT037_010300 [Alternaria burnsii]KAF7671488.1 hypothetical protein GT037_010300 [Alternaria burnsii]
MARLCRRAHQEANTAATAYRPVPPSRSHYPILPKAWKLSRISPSVIGRFLVIALMLACCRFLPFPPSNIRRFVSSLV